MAGNALGKLIFANCPENVVEGLGHGDTQTFPNFRCIILKTLFES